MGATLYLPVVPYNVTVASACVVSTPKMCRHFRLEPLCCGYSELACCPTSFTAASVIQSNRTVRTPNTWLGPESPAAEICVFPIPPMSMLVTTKNALATYILCSLLVYRDTFQNGFRYTWLRFSISEGQWRLYQTYITIYIIY